MKARIFVLFVLAFAIAAPAGAAGTLDTIRKQGVIRIGYIDNAGPFSFIGPDGQPQGYSIDLCRAVAAGIGAQLKLPKLESRWVALTAQNRIESVSKRLVDIECSTTSWTLSRQASVDFSLITFLDGGSVLTRAESDIGRLAGLKGKRIAVIAGTTTEKALRQALDRLSIQAEIVTVKTRDDGLNLLYGSKADGFASDRVSLIALVLKSDRGGQFKLLDEDFSVEPYALMLPRGDHDFRLAVNRVLAGLFREGGIKAIYDRWLGPLGPPSLLLSAAYFVQAIPE